MKGSKRILTVVLALLMTVSVAGCSTGDTSWAYEWNGERMPVGVYLNYLLDAYASAETKYAEIAAEEDPNALYNQPEKSAVLGSQIEETPAKEWIVAEAQKSVYQHYGVKNKMTQDGISLTGEEMESVQLSVASLWEYASDFYESNGISQSSFLSYMIVQKERETLFSHLYGEGGALEVTEAELKDKFQEQYVKGDYMRISKSTLIADAQEIEADNAKIRAQAEEYLDRLRDGEAIEDLIYDYRVAQAQAEEDDELRSEALSQVTKPEEGSFTMILSESDAEYYGTQGEAFMKTRSMEYVMEESSTDIYLVRRLDILEDSQDFESYRATLLGALKYDEYLESLESWGREASPTANSAAISRYTPDRLEVDYSKYFGY